jgi:periplasmic divalent cation tolerance protein
MSDTGMRVVLSTAPSPEVALEIARTLVEERLAACVNLVEPVRSVYRWEGAVEEAREVLLVVKTRADRCAALAARVEALHPYALPEVVVLAIEGGSERYLEWVASESR